MKTLKHKGSAWVDQSERGRAYTPFTLVAVQAVDMFPHTDHVETVAVLDRQR